ncbi:protein of unknown function [Hyphomicrobium sp. 1Nfss2.1]|jgi:Tfp pilus assembly protein PilF|uniref:tetratricopeptide repeat protein n=1 Tax=unclassified Hyphomicrobium TaxID=2619925 RepID=UPI0009303348|nr:tetratricopeptide repeat protein [Hyphomicrobium sp. NDB2Meth4]
MFAQALAIAIVATVCVVAPQLSLADSLFPISTRANPTEAPTRARNRALSKRIYSLAIAQSRGGDLRRAFTLLTKSIRIDPGNALACAARALIRAARGDILGAVGDSDYAIAIDPTLAVAYYNRGLINARVHLWASATEDFKTAALLDPGIGGGVVFDNLGRTLMAQGLFADAIISFTRALSHNPSHAMTYFHRSRAYEKTGQLDAAISDMNASVQAGGAFAEAHHRRAHLFLKRGQDGQALIDLNRALELAPEDDHARADRALLYEQAGDATAARQELSRLRPDYKPGGRDHNAHFGLVE